MKGVERRMILENKAKDNLESPKEFAESVFGVSFGIPVRYVRIPEVEVVSYNEKLILSESSEGEFEIVVKQSPNSVNRVEVGDPIYFLGKQFKNVLSDSVNTTVKLKSGEQSEK